MKLSPVVYSLRSLGRILPPDQPLAGRIFRREVEVETEIDEPTLAVWAPPVGQRNGTVVIICPGGGYEVLAADHEGAAVARWLTQLGVVAAVLRYRVPVVASDAALHDAQTAVRLVRDQAAVWGIDPIRVGFLGFSAGGHLAGCAALGSTSSADRADFLVLLYPVVTFVAPWAHEGSAQALLGRAPTQEQRESWSLERKVAASAPPLFLLHAADDPVVGVENSLALFRAFRAAGRSVEFHVCERGGHGFGLADISFDWTQSCEHWLRRHGWLGAG